MTIVYQAYGATDILNQTIFSIASLLKKAEHDIKVIIYTDRKMDLENFFQQDSRVLFEEITKEQINAWRGKINFVHRVKIEVLKDCGKKYPGDLIYLDGDTYFLDDPEEIFALISDEYSIMHTAEGSLEEGKDILARKIYWFAKKNGIGIDTVMWNAGVIGLSESNKKLFDPVLQMTDQIYKLYPKHIMEQLAFSYHLQKNTTIMPADGIVYHYWDQKPDYQKNINQFLEKNPTLKQALEAYDSFAWPKEPKRKNRKTPWWWYIVRHL